MGPPRELVKLYYRIGEVAQIVGVQPHVLRYWETEFRTIRPQKSHKGQRVYSRRDVEKLLKVKDLLKNQGFTIAGARRKLRDPELRGEHAPLAPATSSVEELAAVPKAEAARALDASRPVQIENPLPITAMLPVVQVHADAIVEARAKMKDALLAIRDDVRALLDELDAPPARRPKLPSAP